MKYDDSLFDDTPHPETKMVTKPVEAKMPQMDDSLFDENPHPEVASRTLASIAQEQNQKGPQQDISANRSALVGAGQGATFGFADELTAPVVAGVGMLDKDIPSLPEESTWEKYQRLMQTYRDVARDEQQAAQDQHPTAYTAGAVGGGLLAPGLGAGKVMAATKGMGLIGRMATGAGVGAGMGALAGAGEAEGDVKERLPAAAEGAKVGAGVGAVFPAAGAALGKAAEFAGQIGDIPLVAKSVESFKRGAKGENLVGEEGRRQAADMVRKKSGELYTDIKGLQNQVGTKIDEKIQAAKEAGINIDLSGEVEDVLGRLQKIKAEGSKEAAEYASSIESEIKKILKIKPEEKGFMGVAEEALPEGLVKPEPKKPNYKIDPESAQDLKQVLNRYTPKRGMAPQQVEPAGVAGDLSKNVSEKLNQATGLNEPQIQPIGGRVAGTVEEGTAAQLPSLNEQYGAIKNTLKRLSINETKLPEQIKEKINKIVAKLGNEGGSGDDAREIVKDVIAQIQKVSPDLASKYEKELGDIAGRLKLSEEITRGLGAGLNLVGTLQSGIKAGANVAGRVANKTGVAKVGSVVGSATKSFANAVLDNSNPVGQMVSNSVRRSETQGAEGVQSLRKTMQPYEIQRQVASAAENADPDFLKDQAQQIRQKHGNQGEQLAQILENMADKNKDARRALMFTVLQNHAYRQMLGLTNEQEQ